MHLYYSNQNRNHYNQHIFANEKQVCLFLYHKTPCFGIWQTLGKHFLPPAGCGSIFPAKSCWDTWRSGSWLARGQVNMADETKFCRPVHSTFEALVVQCAVGRCGKDWTRAFDDYQLQMLQFSMHLINLLSTLLRCNGFARIQKAVVNQTGSNY